MCSMTTRIDSGASHSKYRCVKQTKYTTNETTLINMSEELTVEGACEEDLGLLAATWARYWMTFFVFSVFPAPDSPVHRIL